MDRERSAVYEAELTAFDGTDLEARLDVTAAEVLIERVTAGEWWPGPLVEVRSSRSDARSSSTRCDVDVDGHRATIRLAASQRTIATAAHELAHALAGANCGHDARFRAAYLDVVAIITNLDPSDRRRDLHVRQLADAFEAARLAIGPRGWVAPPDSAAGAIAL